ncbi:YopX family protein [Tissierella praeacuta]|uniref:YopX family protein n=1 Tax=Tissierella praeacuta TaxID=43131 RepID=UPI003DA680E0
MRKIKYKAWSKDLEEFLNITGFECINGEITGIFHDGDYIGYDKDDIALLQYIGINDVDGKEIYEGYIVDTVYGGILKRYIVVWDDSELDFKGTNGKENYGHKFEYLQCCEEIKVVGSIYQNPDLLNQEWAFD